MYAEEVVRAGLDVVDISLYSPIPAVHDAMRGTEGLWQEQRQPSHFLGDCEKNILVLTSLLKLSYAVKIIEISRNY